MGVVPPHNALECVDGTEIANVNRWPNVAKRLGIRAHMSRKASTEAHMHLHVEVGNIGVSPKGNSDTVAFHPPVWCTVQCKQRHTP